MSSSLAANWSISSVVLNSTGRGGLTASRSPSFATVSLRVDRSELSAIEGVLFQVEAPIVAVFFPWIEDVDQRVDKMSYPLKELLTTRLVGGIGWEMLGDVRDAKQASFDNRRR